MRIFHIVETSWGGCGTYLNEVVPLQIIELGIENVRVLVPMQHVSHLTSVDPKAILTFNRPGRLTGLFFFTIVAMKSLKSWRPDVVHVHSTFAGAILRTLFFNAHNAPIVYCAHGWVFETTCSKSARWVMKAAERILSRRCRRIVAISESEKAAGVQAGIEESRLAVIPNGIRDIRCGTASGTWTDSRLKVLFVGRLDRQKGVDILLDAVLGLQDIVCVRIIGENVLSGSANVQCRPAATHVEWLGWMKQADVSSQMQTCDIVVMPSRWEGFGLVAIEAMRAGKPVLASAVGGLREIVVDGVTGYLFPVEDSAAINKLLRECSRDKLELLGVQARQRFLENYTSDKTNFGLMALYREMVTAKS